MGKNLEDIHDVLEKIVPGETREYPFEGNGAISMTTTIGDSFKGKKAELVSVDAHWSSAATTSENFTVTLDSHKGDEYDTVLYSRDPANTSLTSLANIWDKPFPLASGDELVVAFTNTEARLIGGKVVVRKVGE